ncbi:MAG: hypothetical protein ACI4WY_05505 [Anaerovoracaceae bacterium]
MMWLAIMTVLMVIMIWGDLGYGGGAFLVAVLFVAGGWAALIHWAGGKSQDAEPKQNHTSSHSAKSARPASSSRPAPSTRSGAYGGHGASGTGANGGKWDNSDEAGGLPRAVSPFSDIDDPYDRMALEDEMFLEDFEMLSGGNPYDGDSFGGFGDGGFGDGFGDPFGGGWFGEDE